jgi:hypothetical protein
VEVEAHPHLSVLVVNATLRIVLVLCVFKFMEKHVSLETISGILPGAGRATSR